MSDVISAKVLRIKGVCSLTNMSRSFIWAQVKNGTFPQPLALGIKARGWRESEVLDWLKTRPTAKVNPSKAGA